MSAMIDDGFRPEAHAMLERLDAARAQLQRLV
jgi:hypothetical protein